MTVLAKNAPASDPNAPVNHGRWSREMHLLAALIDETRQAGWQRGGDPNAPRPDPFPRPGIDKPISPSRRRHLEKVREAGGAVTTSHQDGDG